ncbi:tRNA-intron lyase [Candidatus Woesearchaeota archaeon CG10_big_fil_rev_8_21_14_0_10_45_16]|nr:MAG: tRNA-intron lyase [Candidatus Woesearchaeota archaeon CG10_big_fil_rev_8_21_14_0_10_45_16]
MVELEGTPKRLKSLFGNIEVMAKKKKVDPGKAAETETSSESKTKKKLVKGIIAGERIITESSDEAREFYNQSRFGSLIDNGKVELSLLEGLYLMERSRLSVKSQSGREVKFESYVKRARKVEPNFWIRYVVFRDMRNRGYIIKTALKFGADFRVYDRGVKPGEDHARWIVFPVHEASVFTWHEFSAKNRVAHSTKKRLLLGVVDDEGDVTYYEVKWMRP